MKTILLLTDFSESADHAAQSAIMLCSKLRTNLMLFNNICGIPEAKGYGSEFLSSPNDHGYETEIHEKLKKTAGDIAEATEHLKRGQYKPSISFEAGTGNLRMNVQGLIEKHNVEFIVMGARSDSTLERILNNNNTSSIIDCARCPIIIVPQGSSLKKLKKVTFATDFNKSDIGGIRYITELGSVFGFQLDIVHVDPLDRKGEIQEEKEAAFKREIDELRYPSVMYHAVKGKDVVKRLTRLCEESESGLLAIVYYYHSFFIRMLHQSTAKKVLCYQRVPLMILPSERGD